ncbi:MAG: cation-transporting P-type ATPase [Trueperaceae bacterium]|nr:cation-transporting P-type ATPase [Trueperaceae bacterium]
MGAPAEKATGRGRQRERRSAAEGGHPPEGRTDAPWAEAPERALARFGVDPALGLGPDAVEAARRRFGGNVLDVGGRRSAVAVLVEQFKSVLVALLAVAAGLSAYFGQVAEAVAVLVVLVLNALIGFVTELRAVRSVEALKRLGTAHARVRRAGRLQTVPAEDLVPGDILLVEGGDVVSADARILKCSRLEADESSLTGESVPVAKEPAAVAALAPLPERSSMLYKGTAVTRGGGEAVVVATGMATELGRISRLVTAATRAPGSDGGTPLERRLDGLAHRLVWLTLGVAVLVTLTGLGSGKEWLVLLETAIALAVATVPEGLPIIATLTLAQGVRRMARRNALVNRLAAVETLGATSVIITDKTGTLTENRMAVASVWLPAGEVGFEAGGPNGDGVAAGTGDLGDPHVGKAGGRGLGEQLRHALAAAALCVTAELPSAQGAPGEPGANDGGVGDPLELALLRAARAAGLERSELLARHPELRQEAFDPNTRVMATTHRLGDDPGAGGAPAEGSGDERPGATRMWQIVKGAPGAVVAACATLADGRSTPLDPAGRAAWLERNRALAARGLRVLALAERTGGVAEGIGTGAAGAEGHHDLALIGLVGLADPPRPEVRGVLERCRAAGIRVVMATGDQAATASAVAAAVGLEAPQSVVDGRVMAQRLADGAAGEAELLTASVFARMAPEQKLELIAMHQRAGNVVAMTGDGVNDAPALRQADIGVAMGRAGTDVAREAADMVLLDDAFGTIVAAVREGRIVFENIRAFVLYLLSCNLSEVLVVGLAAVLGYPLPLLPLQILFINLVTDVFPALALGAGRGDQGGLARPPRPATEALLARRHWRAVVGYGAVLTAATLVAFGVALELLGAAVPEAVTVAFIALALGQVWHVFNMREPGTPALRNQLTRNPWVWAATVGCTLLVLLAVALPPLRLVLQVEPLPPAGWLLAVAAALAPLLVGQVGKAFGLGRVV